MNQNAAKSKTCMDCMLQKTSHSAAEAQTVTVWKRLTGLTFTGLQFLSKFFFYSDHSVELHLFAEESLKLSCDK